MVQGPLLTISEVCHLISQREGQLISPWMVRSLYARGLLSEAPRLGSQRAYVERDLPNLIDGLRRGGYLELAATVSK